MDHCLLLLPRCIELSVCACVCVNYSVIPLPFCLSSLFQFIWVTWSSKEPKYKSDKLSHLLLWSKSDDSAERRESPSFWCWEWIRYLSWHRALVIGGFHSGVRQVTASKPSVLSLWLPGPGPPLPNSWNSQEEAISLIAINSDKDNFLEITDHITCMVFLLLGLSCGHVRPLHINRRAWGGGDS